MSPADKKETSAKTLQSHNENKKRKSADKTQKLLKPFIDKETQLGGRLVYDDDKFFRNEQFGELVNIVELYNNYLALYQLQSPEDNSIKLDKIEFGKFTEALLHDGFCLNSDSYLLKIFETLVLLIIRNNPLYSKYTMIRFVFTFKKFADEHYDPMSMQEICRVLFNIDSQTEGGHDEEANEDHKDNSSHEEHENENDSIEDKEAHEITIEKFRRKNAFYYNDEYMNSTHLNETETLIKALHELELKDFSIEMKIRLFRVLCHRFITLSIFDDTAPKKSTAKNKEEVEALQKSCMGIKPIGCDDENNFYWKFDCIEDKIIREQREFGFDKQTIESKWFEYNSKNEEFNNLIEHQNKIFLNASQSSVNLKNLLDGFKDIIEEEARPVQVEKKKEKPKVVKEFLQTKLPMRASRRLAENRLKNIYSDSMSDEDNDVEEMDEDNDVVETDEEKDHLTGPLFKLFKRLEKLAKLCFESGLFRASMFIESYMHNLKQMFIECYMQESKQKFDSSQKQLFNEYKKFLKTLVENMKKNRFSLQVYLEHLAKCHTISSLNILTYFVEITVLKDGTYVNSVKNVTCSRCLKSATIDMKKAYVACVNCLEIFHLSCTEEYPQEDKQKADCWWCKICEDRRKRKL